jgi:hypothetical protein
MFHIIEGEKYFVMDERPLLKLLSRGRYEDTRYSTIYLVCFDTRQTRKAVKDNETGKFVEIAAPMSYPAA